MAGYWPSSFFASLVNKGLIIFIMAFGEIFLAGQGG